MKTVDKNLKIIINKLNGNLSIFGNIYEDVLDYIDKSKKIIKCDLINEYSPSFFSKKGDKEKTKKFNIKKLKRIYGKKSLDTIMINIDDFDKYKKSLFPDSIFISKSNVIIYSNNSNYDYNIIETRYKRYNTKYNYIECSNGFIIEVDTRNSVYNKSKNNFYYIKDSIYDIIEKVSDFIIN